MPATRQQLEARLADLGIAFETHDHPPVFTVEEARAHCGHLPGCHCKNLFLKDKKGELWLVVARDDAPIRLNELQRRMGAARVSFGKPDLLMEVMGVEPGSVTPFGLINDTQHRVNVVLDEKMMAAELVNYHPLTNGATLALAPDGLLAFLRATGHEPTIMDVDGTQE